MRDHSSLWSSVDPTFPSPLPCYGPLTAGSPGSLYSRAVQSSGLYSKAACTAGQRAGGAHSRQQGRAQDQQQQKQQQRQGYIDTQQGGRYSVAGRQRRQQAGRQAEAQAPQTKGNVYLVSPAQKVRLRDDRPPTLAQLYPLPRVTATALLRRLTSASPTRESRYKLIYKDPGC